MINPVGQIFSIGIIVGIFLVVLLGSMVIVFDSNGKEPEFVEMHNENEEGHWICPRCGQDVSFYEWRNNYCSDCGQKIDWRRVDEQESI